MLEMSVEKETVVVGDVGGGSLPYLHGSKDMPPPKMVPGGELVTPLLTSMGLPDGLGGGKTTQPKNGLQGPHPAQQKLSKRRYSMNLTIHPPTGGPAKRRRRASESQPILPSHFLLGGNIFDPLNLNSLLDEEVSRALNARTPESSPLPIKSREPLEILVPKDITDPLNLSGRCGGTDDRVLLSPLKRRRHRNRHHGTGVPEQADLEKGRHVGTLGEDETVEAAEGRAGMEVEEPVVGPVLLEVNQDHDSPQPYELNTSINCRDEVVPPILPRRHSQSGSSTSSQTRHPPGATDSAPSGQPSTRSRKRKRTISRSDRLSITPTPTVAPLIDRGGRNSTDTFQTPLVNGAQGGNNAVSSQLLPIPRKTSRKYHFGTHSCYYGYRTPALSEDPRLAVLKPEWFHCKKVLDIGCNTGHITLAIAKHWDPIHILGIDIDGELVHAARQNLRHFLSECPPPRGQGHNSPQNKMADGPRQGVAQEGSSLIGSVKSPGILEPVKATLNALMDMQLDAVVPSAARRPFLLSFRHARGPIAAPLLRAQGSGFPHNVLFLKENYVLEHEEQLAGQQAEYDVILCLDLAMWVQLNWGDGGLQRLFRRAYRQLCPGGLFILEPQPWSSYSRRKKISETTYRNYCSIRLKPDQFTGYLTSEVGFSSYELLGTPTSTARGIPKPMYVFHKGPSHSRK